MHNLILQEHINIKIKEKKGLLSKRLDYFWISYSFSKKINSYFSKKEKWKYFSQELFLIFKISLQK